MLYPVFFFSANSKYVLIALLFIRLHVNVFAACGK